jgi:hypothetical protein
MLLQNIVRNHPEDTVSDILWYICKKDYIFSRELLSRFIYQLDDFSIIDVIRNYIIYDGVTPDLTILLQHKKTNELIYIIIETDITVKDNNNNTIYKKTSNQYGTYTNYLNNKNKSTQLHKEYNLPDKCILLCPSYFDNKYEDGNVKQFKFSELLALLVDSDNSDTEEIRNELIKYIEKFEGTYSHLNKNLGILEYKTELKSAQKHLLALRDTMLKEKEISKSGLWQTNSECYCYFGIGLKSNYTPKNEGKSLKYRSWLSYDFFSEEDIFSPLKLNFPNKLIRKNLIHVAKHQNKYKFYCDLLIESKLNNKFIDIFNLTNCSEKLKTNILNFTNYYNQENKHAYLIKFNEFLRSIVNFIDIFDDEISNEYNYTYFEHSLSKKEILLCLKIKTRVNGKHHISIIAEPTSFDINQILRMEIFKDAELIDTIELISETNKGYEVKYDLNALKQKIHATFNKLYGP